MTADADFDAAFADLARLAYRVAYRLLGVRAEAEDVAQEALARAYARWRRVHGHAEPWVARVAANLALDRLRSHDRSRRAEVPVADAAAADDATRAAVDRLELAHLLSSLPRRQREVVVLRYLADRSEADVARELGTSVGTVKRHAHRGLATLREAWTGLDLEPIPDRGGA
ncbi:MAG: sigma-70 family RNA polymerase sigma factor [Acidimicrobiales bacterium]|nr:sigma-70 family RNA polymerase sigma factor [Acidimicrobiales bacterium]HRW36364.1 sigma-70 family RNA polymerase sigma factor [Aquihabitans sp.]